MPSRCSAYGGQPNADDGKYKCDRFDYMQCTNPQDVSDMTAPGLSEALKTGDCRSKLKKCATAVRDRAARMDLDHEKDHASRGAAIGSIAARIGSAA